MSVAEVLSVVLGVIIFIGGPIVPLLILAIEIGRWHKLNPDPPEEPE